MSNKILIALAAFAVLSTAAIASTSASAAPQNHPGHGIPGGAGHPGWHPHNWHPHNWHPYIVRYRVRTAPVTYVARAPVAYVAPAPVAAVAAPCTCLTKEYTQEGAVLFKDICTNEAAINPPAEIPQQTGMLQAQPQQ